MNKINDFKSDFITGELNKKLDISSKDLEGLNTMEAIEDYVNEIINEQEIVYNFEAIEYLKVNDASLRYSLELAEDLGYSLKKLNSEILATLLYQNDLRDDFNNLIDKYN